MESIKIALFGSSGSGKTAYMNRHVSGEFIRQHIPSVENTNYKVKFTSNYGDIDTLVYENPTNNNFYDAYIVMFDTGNKESFIDSFTRVEDILLLNPDVNIIWCGNKVDIRNRVVKVKEIMKYQNKLKRNFGKDVVYYDLSAKSNYNFSKPFLTIFRNILGKDLVFVDNNPLPPPEITIDEKLLEKIEKELLKSREIGLPIEDWDDEYEEKDDISILSKHQFLNTQLGSLMFRSKL